MNLFKLKRTLMAASGMAALTTFGMASAATAVPVTSEMIAAQADRVLMLRAQAQWLQAQARDMEANLQELLETQRRGEAGPELAPMGANSPDRQGGNCNRPGGSQSGASCGGGGMMQGMMQMMTQMMGGLMR